MAAFDLETLTRLRHPEWGVYLAAVGRAVRGNEAFAEIIRNYPGGEPETEVTRIVGSEDRWVVTPGNTVLARRRQRRLLVAPSGGSRTPTTRSTCRSRSWSSATAASSTRPLLGGAVRGAELARSVGRAGLIAAGGSFAARIEPPGSTGSPASAGSSTPSATSSNGLAPSMG